LIKIGQCINRKRLVKVKKNATEMFNLLHEVYGENTLSRAHVFEWCKSLLEGRKDVEDDK
jgi:hypothetical protein